ncbi:SRPBCC family protein [Actinokineospora soli]
MHLEHTFHVPAPTPDVWTALLDPHRVAPCMPGAALTAVEGTTFEGKVKVKLGPISLTYKGKGEFVTQDEAMRTITIRATGKDTAGNGTASATVTVTLTPQGETTTGTVHTDLSITGKPAQFGRGLISEVGGKILDTFATCLSKKLAAPATKAGPAATATEPPHAGPERPAATATTEPERPAATDATEPERPAATGTTEPERPAATDATEPERPAATGTTEPERPAATGTTEPERPAATATTEPAAAAPEQPTSSTTTEPEAPPPTSPQRPTLAAVPEAEAEVEPIDLMAYAGRSVTKRAIPVALLLAVIGVIIAVAQRKRR